MSLVPVRVARRSPLPAVDTQARAVGSQSGAIGSARLIASLTSGRSSSSWWSVRRGTSGSSARVDGHRLPGAEVDRRQDLLIDPEARRAITRRAGIGTHSPATAVDSARIDDNPAVRPRQAHGPRHGLGDPQPVDRDRRRPVHRVVAYACPAARREGPRARTRAGRRGRPPDARGCAAPGIGGRSPGALLPTFVEGGLRRIVVRRRVHHRVLGRDGPRRRSSSIAIPRSMLVQRPGHLALEADDSTPAA